MHTFISLFIQRIYFLIQKTTECHIHIQRPPNVIYLRFSPLLDALKKEPLVLIFRVFCIFWTAFNYIFSVLTAITFPYINCSVNNAPFFQVRYINFIPSMIISVSILIVMILHKLSSTIPFSGIRWIQKDDPSEPNSKNSGIPTRLKKSKSL